VVWHGFWLDGNKLSRKLYFPASYFAYVELLGVKVLAPVKAEQWVKLDYGEEEYMYPL
jgi:hypothetical protein